MRIILKLLKIGGVGLVVVLVAGFLIFAYLASGLPQPEKFLEESLAESTKIFDKTGQTLLFELGSERRTWLEYDQIPQVVVQATLVAEDREFFNHPGIDVKGIARAVLVSLKTREFRQGGSTITQQLVKNLILSPRKKLSRKIREVILALELERRYSKEDILKFYLNSISYGSNAFGVEAASKLYFDKPVSELTVAEAALLAALPNAPTYLSPYGSHKEELETRQRWVLEGMKEQGYIDQKTLQEALAQELKFAPQVLGIRAPHFVMFVREYLEEKYGKELIDRGGLRVITTLDWDLQKKAEEIVARLAEDNQARFKASNAALVAINPKDGRVVAMVGSKDYFNTGIDGNVNVTIRRRQPGSAFKPVVYATAFEKGYTPNTVLFDLETEFSSSGRPYKPRNYTGKESGPVTMREALARSLNIPAVKTLYLAGINESLDMAERLGITTLQDRSRYGLSLVLGGGEVKLLELTGAYGVFANEGRRADLQVIKEIYAADGSLLEQAGSASKQVIETNIARMITDILSDNETRAPVFGLNSYLYIAGLPVAAKSGTTQDFRDGWTIGYSTGLVAGVWVGNNDNTPMARGADGTSIAGPIWNEFIKEAIKMGYQAEPFVKPDIPVREKPVLDGELAANVPVLVDVVTGKLATDYTPPELIEERIYQEVHTILYWVDRKNPLGPAPSDPGSDPQFANWEKEVLEWVKEQQQEGKFYNEPPPSEYDDVHIPKNIPVLEVSAPTANKVLRTPEISVSLQATAPLGIDRIEVYFDHYFLGTIRGDSPWKRTFDFPYDKSLLSGSHLVIIKAYDPVLNKAEKSIPIKTSIPSDLLVPPKLSVSVLPQPISFPASIILEADPSLDVAQVIFFLAPTGQPSASKVLDTRTKKSPAGRFVGGWFSKPEPGDYVVWAEVLLSSGRRLQSPFYNVTIGPNNQP